MSDRIGLNVEEISDLIVARNILARHTSSLFASNAHEALIVALKNTYLDLEKTE